MERQRRSRKRAEPSRVSASRRVAQSTGCRRFTLLGERGRMHIVGAAGSTIFITSHFTMPQCECKELSGVGTIQMIRYVSRAEHEVQAHLAAMWREREEAEATAEPSLKHIPRLTLRKPPARSA
eukprot:4759858-Pleurochrysis_carterae.AAC.3